MTTTSPTTTNRTPKALLLDDDATVLRLLGTTLEARGFAVRAATEGVGGLALLLDELLDLVGRAGGERDLGVVVLAGPVAPGVREQLLALGADMVVDRRAGPALAAEAVSALARRNVRPARRAARPASQLL